MDDWRLTNQKDYLLGRRLIRCDFSKLANKDHEHCSFCWEKFGHSNDDLNTGYCTEDYQHWVCDTCFGDFKDEFDWSVY